MTFRNVYRTALAFTAATAALMAGTATAEAATVRLYGLTESNMLTVFDLDDLSATSHIGVSGIDGTLLGIDFRSANGLLYGITDANSIYTINTMTGAATLESTLSPLSFNGGQTSGFDFNPAADRLRLEDSGQNFRINVDTGAVADSDAATPGVQPDGDLAFAAGDVNEGATPTVASVGYTNAFPGAPAGRSTELYVIDSALDALLLQSPPNDGTLNTIGDLGFDFEELGGFDILSGSAGDNAAYATSRGMLYSLDLGTGAASGLGKIGDGNMTFVGLATESVPEPASAAALLGVGCAALASRRRQTAA